jgi:hypothetical protein
MSYIEAMKLIISYNLSAICEPIVYKMREPRHLTILWASIVCYRDSLFLITLFKNSRVIFLTTSILL